MLKACGLSAFATGTKNKPVVALELRHRQCAGAENRIRAARTAGLRDLPLPRHRAEPDLAGNRRARPVDLAALDAHAR
ncbi:hypothetical protein GA0115254_118612 [Streptomyces sp. Ncost-T10-10d]|nr:hypothetical protein GA0115254_118612 [Streptomyces sp. Ncost-T10-10d]